MAMHSHENKSKNNSWNHTPTTAANPFQTRSFGIQAKSESEESSSLQEETDAKAESPKQYGINLLTIPVHAPGTAPPPPIQTKLTIGQPGDQYEQEADSVAAKVVSQIHSPSFSQSNQGAVAQRQSEEEGEKEEQKEVVQAKSLAPPPPENPSPKTQPEILQRPDTNLLSRISIFQPGTTPPPPIQTKQIFGQAKSETAAQPNLESSIQQARGGGQPLADGIRQPMEQAFGANFSGVRVHTGAQSDQMNQSIQAKAFTTGQDVFFRQGAYDPSSRGGQELIAHELTHVVQQNPSTSQTQISPKRMSVTPTSTNKIQRGPGKDGYTNLKKDADPESEAVVYKKLGKELVATYRIMSDATDALAKGKNREAIKQAAIGFAQAAISVATILTGIPSIIDEADLLGGNLTPNIGFDSLAQDAAASGLEMGLDEVQSDAANPNLAKAVEKTTVKGVLQSKLDEKVGSLKKIAKTILDLLPFSGAVQSLVKSGIKANKSYDDWNKEKGNIARMVKEIAVAMEDAISVVDLENFGDLEIVTANKKLALKTTRRTLEEVVTTYREKSEAFKAICDSWSEKHEETVNLLTPDSQQKQDFSKLNPDQEDLSLDEINQILSN